MSQTSFRVKPNTGVDPNPGDGNSIGGFYSQIVWDVDKFGRKKLYLDKLLDSRRDDIEPIPLAVGDELKIDGESQWRKVKTLPSEVISKDGRAGRNLTDQYYGPISLTNNLQHRNGKGLVAHADIDKSGKIFNVSFLGKKSHGYYKRPELEIIPQDGESGGANLYVITQFGKVIGIHKNWPGEYGKEPVLVESRGYDIRKTRNIRIGTIKVESTNFTNIKYDEDETDPIQLLPSDGYDQDIDRYFIDITRPHELLSIDFFIIRNLFIYLDNTNVNIDLSILSRNEFIDILLDYFNEIRGYNLEHWINKLTDYRYFIDFNTIEDYLNLQHDITTISNRRYNIKLPEVKIDNFINLVIHNRLDYTNINIERFISLFLDYEFSLPEPKIDIIRYTSKVFNHFLEGIKNDLFVNTSLNLITLFKNKLDISLEYINLFVRNTKYLFDYTFPSIDVSSIVRNVHNFNFDTKSIDIEHQVDYKIFNSFDSGIVFNEPILTRDKQIDIELNSGKEFNVNVDIGSHIFLNYDLGDVSTELNLILEYESKLSFKLDKEDSTAFYLDSVGENYPRDGGIVRIGLEEVKYSRRIGTRFFIETRGINGTVAQDWPEGTSVFVLDRPTILFFFWDFYLEYSSSFDITSIGKDNLSFFFEKDYDIDMSYVYNEEIFISFDYPQFESRHEIIRDIFVYHEYDYGEELSIEEIIDITTCKIFEEDLISSNVELNGDDELENIEYERNYEEYAEYGEITGNETIRQGTRLAENISASLASGDIIFENRYPGPTRDSRHAIVLLGEEPVLLSDVRRNLNRGLLEARGSDLLSNQLIQDNLEYLEERSFVPFEPNYWKAGTFVEFVTDEVYTTYGIDRDLEGESVNIFTRRTFTDPESGITNYHLDSVDGPIIVYYEIPKTLLMNNVEPISINAWANISIGYDHVEIFNQKLEDSVALDNWDDRTENIDDWKEIDDMSGYWNNIDTTTIIPVEDIDLNIRLKFVIEESNIAIDDVNWQYWRARGS